MHILFSSWGKTSKWGCQGFDKENINSKRKQNISLGYTEASMDDEATPCYFPKIRFQKDEEFHQFL